MRKWFMIVGYTMAIYSGILLFEFLYKEFEKEDEPKAVIEQPDTFVYEKCLEVLECDKTIKEMWFRGNTIIIRLDTLNTKRRIKIINCINSM